MKPDIAAARAWIQAGNVGTVKQIAKAIGVKPGTVYWYMRRLSGEGEATVVDIVAVPRAAGAYRGAVPEHVWGKPQPVTQQANIVSAAMASRTPMELAWMARPGQYLEEPRGT